MVLIFTLSSCKTIVINLNCNCEKKNITLDSQITDSFVFPNIVPFDNGILKSESDWNIQNTPYIKINKK